MSTLFRRTAWEWYSWASAMSVHQWIFWTRVSSICCVSACLSFITQLLWGNLLCCLSPMATICGRLVAKVLQRIGVQPIKNTWVYTGQSLIETYLHIRYIRVIELLASETGFQMQSKFQCSKVRPKSTFLKAMYVGCVWKWIWSGEQNSAPEK